MDNSICLYMCFFSKLLEKPDLINALMADWEKHQTHVPKNSTNPLEQAIDKPSPLIDFPLIQCGLQLDKKNLRGIL